MLESSPPVVLRLKPSVQVCNYNFSTLSLGKYSKQLSGDTHSSTALNLHIRHFILNSGLWEKHFLFYYVKLNYLFLLSTKGTTDFIGQKRGMIQLFKCSEHLVMVMVPYQLWYCCPSQKNSICHCRNLCEDPLIVVLVNLLPLKFHKHCMICIGWKSLSIGKEINTCIPISVKT